MRFGIAALALVLAFLATLGRCNRWRALLSLRTTLASQLFSTQAPIRAGTWRK